MKKIAIGTAVFGLVATIAFVVFGITRTTADPTTFPADGSVLLGDTVTDDKQIPVSAGETYKLSKGGSARFRSSDGKAQLTPSKSFVYYSDDSTMALADGVLLDFNDMSGSFINNYCVPASMMISRNGSAYEAVTTNGSLSFGDNLWKLDDSKYLIQSPKLKIAFSPDDIREVNNYVQVSVSDDGIVKLLTPENIWTTLSAECYVETENGTKIYPIAKRVDNGSTRLSIASLSVDADDLITLTPDEERRQIVPEIVITAVDGKTGDDGEDGKNGNLGADGTDGTDGEDGVDGTDGDDGAAGNAGTSGSSGAQGVTGYNGDSGSKGIDGKEGIGGIDRSETEGEPGAPGGSGSEGAGGQVGFEGVGGNSGEDGVKGAGGQGGNKGDDGLGGDNGLGGDDGINGTQGGTGDAGRDASQTTTVNSIVPVITITEWNVSSRGVSGILTTSDPNGFFKAVDETVGGLKDSCPAYVRIVNVSNPGDVTYCYPVAQDSGFDSQINFYDYINKASTQSVDIGFGTDPAQTKAPGISSACVLQPDTSYRLEVLAYYKAENTLYNRIFASRNFYTDSSGIILSTAKQESNSVTVNMKTTDNSITGAEVYIMDYEDAELFTINDLSNCYYVYSFNFENGTAKGEPVGKKKGISKPEYSFEKESTDMVFVPVSAEGIGCLACDRKYAARVVITYKEGGLSTTTLSSQILEAWTLKRTPTWDKTKKPQAVYNRVTGAFEVYRPVVEDPDNSVVKYRYTAKKYNETTKTWDQVAYHDVTPTDTDPVEFYELVPGKENLYRFEVQIETDDNEKAVYYEMGESDTVFAVGATLPRMNFTQLTHTFNSAGGRVNIYLDASSDIVISPIYPLTIDISCDEYYSNQIVLYAHEQDGIRSTYKDPQHIVSDWGITEFMQKKLADSTIATYTWDAEKEKYIFEKKTFDTGETVDSNNMVSFNFDLKDLYNNHKYTGIVTGYIRLGTEEDGFTYVEREIGSFTFKTLEPTPATVTWRPTDIASGNLDVMVSIATEDKTGYEIPEIQKGQVAINLYKGQGTKGQLMGTAYINSSADLAKITSEEGLELKASMFTKQAVSKDKESYTLKVASISDETYDLPQCTEYTNYFPVINNDTTVITKEPAPPDLTDEPQAALQVEPLPKSVAAALYRFGADSEEDPDPKVSNDAIEGFRLIPTYDNGSGLATKINYSIFEYNDFDASLVNKKDPVGNSSSQSAVPDYGISRVFEVSLDITGTPEDLPTIAVVFDGTPGEEPRLDPKKAPDGSYIYHVAPLAEVSDGQGGTVKKGMSRGYRYCMAYTVNYKTTSSTGAPLDKLYPYDHPDYDAYTEECGIGSINGYNLYNHENKVAYILNSGIIEAPLDKPVFYTYLDKAVPNLKSEGVSQLVEATATGEAFLNYYYEDPDKTIKPGAMVYYNNLDALMKKEFVPVEAENEWQMMSFSFTSYINDPSTASSYSSTNLFIEPRVEYSIYHPSYVDVLGKYHLPSDDTMTPLGSMLMDWDWDGFMQEFNAKNPENTIPAVTLNDKTDMNYYEFDFDLDGYTQVLAERAYASRITVTDDADSTKTMSVILPVASMTTAGNKKQYYTRFSLGLLAGEVEFGNKVTFKAELLFDNGRSGWKFAYPNTDVGTEKLEPYFGLYYLNVDPLTGGFSSVGYLTKELTTSEAPGGGLFIDINTDDHPELIPATRFSKAVKDKKRTKAEFLYKISSNGQFTRWLFPFEYGVDASSGKEEMGTYDGNILFPKGVSGADCRFKNSGGGGGSVSIIVPTMEWKGYNGNKNYIKVNDFPVTGIGNTDAHPTTEFLRTNDYVTTDTYHLVYAAVYDDKHQKQAGDVSTVGDTTKGWITTEVLVFDDNGIYCGACRLDGTGGIIEESFVPVVRDSRTGVATGGFPTLHGPWNEAQQKYEDLEEETDFFVSFFMDFQNGTRKNILIDKDCAERGEANTQAVYAVRTSNGVTVTLSKAVYDKNDSYFDKGVSFMFDVVPSAVDITFLYELYLTDADARRGSYPVDVTHPSTPAIPYLTLTSEQAKQLLTEPLVYGQMNNTVTVDLTPENIEKINRNLPDEKKIKNLVPGSRYYLRVTAMGSDGKEAGEVDKCYGKMAISVPRASTGFSAELNSRTTTTLSYVVSASDKQHMLMGYNYWVPGDDPTADIPIPVAYNKSSMYVVRFTDDEGNLVESDYDNRVFSALDLQRILSIGDTSGALSPGEQYTCNIFAVKDDGPVVYSSDKKQIISCEVLDGLSPAVNEAGEQHTWDWFFGDLIEDKIGEELVGFKFPATSEHNIIKLIDSIWSKSQLDPETGRRKKISTGDAKVIWDNFFIDSATKRTESGSLYIEPNTETFSFVNNKMLRLTLNEAEKVVTLDESTQPPTEQQGFEEIYWSIKEVGTGDQDYYDLYKTSDEDAELMFKPVYDKDGKLTSSFTLDMSLTAGGIESFEKGKQYKVEVWLYKEAAVPAATYKYDITITY